MGMISSERSVKQPEPPKHTFKVAVFPLFDNKTVTKIISLGTATAEIGGYSAAHVHEHWEEIMYVVKGKALLITGNISHESGEGEAVYAPAGVKHGYKNIGQEPLKILWAYASVE